MTKLREVAHSRTGDKGNISNISLIAYRMEMYPLLKEQVTAERVKAWFQEIVQGEVRRYELPKIGALNFVLFDALGGGVTRSLALDRHGKSLSSALLEMEIKEDFTIRDFRMKKEEYDMTEWLEGEVYANGITIHYYRTGGDKKPSILLLHGFTDNGLCWSRVAHELEGSYDVVMTDARGHGRSGGIATGFSTTILADDAAALIRALGLEKPYLFGHSMGARTAATVAANYPDLVRAIVLEDPPLVDRLPFQTNEGQAGRQRWQWVFDLKALPREERIARGFAMNPNWAEEEIIPWADSKAEVQTDVLERGGAPGSYPWREIIARIACPILLITGDPESGAIVTPEAAQEAAHLWQHGEVVHIPGAGHNIRRDRYDEMMAAVKAFLNKL